MRSKPPVKYDFSFLYFLAICLLALVVMMESVSLLGYFPSRQKLTSVSRPPSEAIVPTQPKRLPGFMSIILAGEQKIIPNKTIKTQLIFASANTPIAGVDAIIRFDPKLVMVEQITPNKKVFDQILINRQQEKEGRIKITAYSPGEISQLIGPMTLAFMDLKLFKNAPTLVELEFEEVGNLGDSNLIPEGFPFEDLLGEVYPLFLEPR